MAKDILVEALDAITSTKDTKALESLRLRYLGRKGIVTLQLHKLSKLPASERAAAGKAANEAKQRIEQAIAEQQQIVDLQDVADAEPLDVTAPGKGQQLGHLHPVQSLQQQLIEIFWQIGFQVADGPEIETDWYNFEALNIPADHPARDMQDTFYLENGLVPRTHTSSVQIRYMEKNKPPIRIIAPGSVYRNEDEDATHLWAFKQIEGLVVDKDISMADLKGTLLYMLQGVFGEDAKLRLRPNFFPYTEPSVEMDASCMICKGKSLECKTCKGTGWVELGGAGMVHPRVLKNVGIDPEMYSGFAFGFGIDRIAAIKYQVNDIRGFWRPNLKFLEQF